MSEFEPTFNPEQSPAETGMNLDALKFEQTKGEVNLNIANKYYHPPEYEDTYSGICDVDSPEVARAMADKLRETRKDPNRKIMIGVMTTPIILNPELPVPEAVRNGVAKEFLAKEEISRGFTDDPDVLNTIHYADLYGPDGPWKGQESPEVCKNLELCVKYGGENLHAIQLDITWPKPDEIKMFKEKHPDILIILQLGKNAMDEVNSDPQEIVSRLAEYGDSIDHVLLDLSMGKGRKMDETDVAVIRRLLNVIQYKLPDLGLALAGGLGAASEADDSSGSVYSMEALERIAADFPNISIDAQTGIKPDGAPTDFLGHSMATTPADSYKAARYIERASEILDNNTDLTNPDQISWI
ncbi:MAG: hypothetical protein NTV39_04355 [Candidatus Saccharibacteria bacterium]|nr:hypothetical protein [Candidatus Saccharibacteria bacterium]